MNIGAFGGGQNRIIKVSVDQGRIRGVKARVGLFGSDLAVFTEPKYLGMVGVPFWENQLVHQALELAVQTKKYDVYNKKNLLYQMVADLYTAKRQTLHILWANYGISFKSLGEKKDLTDALQALQLVNSLFIGLRQGNLTEVGLEIQRVVDKILGKIGTQPHDQLKRESRNLMVEVGKIVSPTGKNIPQPQISRVEAARWRLQDRVTDILAIEPKILARRQTLVSVIELCELRFQALEDFLERLLSHLSKHYFDSHGGYDLCQKVNSRLTDLVRDLVSIDLRPFYFPGQMILRETQRASRLIQAGNYVQARAILNTSWQSLRLRIARSDMENLITHLTRQLFRPQQKLRPAEIIRIKKRLRSLTTCLASIDESRFKQPVCQPALALINEGAGLIKYRVYGQAAMLQPIKENLVAAAQLI